MRKSFVLCLVACSLQLAAFPQYWQQHVSYLIDVTLNDKEHTLDGFERIGYTNNSPDTLHFIWFHLWPNAFKNDKTAFSDQLLENGSTAFYFSDKEQRGYINRLDFKVNNITATTEDHPEHIDIIKLVLPAPLPPGEKITITTPFHVKLPYNFSRGGHKGQSYQVTQWYPRPAVYDRKGWHPIPYLDQGEFYSEFGSFDVRITVPENYIVAATGLLQDEAEKKRLHEMSERLQIESPVIKLVQKIKPPVPESSTETKTLQYLQDSVLDFAWFADKEFLVLHDTTQLRSGRQIDIYSYFKREDLQAWSNSPRYIKETIHTRSEWIGEYPYHVVSVVEAPPGYGGGMEYPTITIVGYGGNERMLEFTIAHEVSHNWFYGILGTNERIHPWMDEGLNTYYDNRHAQWKYGEEGELSFGNQQLSIRNAERMLFQAKTAVKKDQPIETRGDKFTLINYSLIAYYKTGAWFEYLEKELGKGTFDQAIQEYYASWKFKHPYPEDLKQIFERVSGKELTAQFQLLEKKGIIPGMETKGWKIASPLAPGSIINYINQPSAHLLTIAPAIGFNSYDKFMAGVLFTNYKLPPSRFQFFAAPMYSTKGKTLNGIGNINYSFFPDGYFRKIDLFLNASKFSMNEFLGEDGEKTLFGFQKLAPGLRLVFSEMNPRSTRERFLQWKSYFINEESYRIRYDTVINVDTTIVQRVGTVESDRVLHQLRFVVADYRALYPYSGELKLEKGEDFLRAAFTGNYFFNYVKEGGLNVRLFAGKFFYDGSKTFSKQFATDRYHLNMTGANGYEDYTYSDYFIGRNKFEGLASQQIMVRDGGFKIRTDLYADKVGKSDEWLAALNLTSSVPSGLNPLTMLPIKIPLKVFADIGTYGEAWERDADLDRFIFEAGLQVSLFNDLVNIYVPVIYSRIYKDYIQSVYEKKGRFWKTISFSIDISNFSLRKVNRELSF